MDNPLAGIMARIFYVILLLACPVLADERILSFESHIVVEKGGDVVVTEKIQVRAEGNEIKRGIYRDLPRVHTTKWGLKKKKPFKVLAVRKNGEAENFVVEEIGQAGIRIRIGQQHVLLPRGNYTYEIVYRTGRQLYFETKRDVLYWNVNGTEWGFPTDQVSATVVLPEGIEATMVSGSSGKRGEKGKDFEARSSGNMATFAATRGFGPNENLTQPSHRLRY